MVIASTYLSVVVPVLNEATLMPISSCRLRQIAPDAEIIVVDGGSDDATASIAQMVPILSFAPQQAGRCK